MPNLLTRFEKSLLEAKILKKGRMFSIACSGGPDSMALFYLLVALKDKWSLKLRLLHANHQLRGKQSKTDELFVKRVGKQHHVPVDTVALQVKKWARKKGASLEEAARELRYQFLIREAKKKKAYCLLTAHTQDDQAETVFMRVLQGTGLRGLCGIRRIIKMNGACFVRPLLGFTKAELLDFLRENDCSFRKDESNQSTRFLRNWIRLELFPLLKQKLNARIIPTLARIPEIVSEESELLDQLEVELWKKVSASSTAKSRKIKRDAFLKIPPPLQFRILNRALKQIDAQSGVSFDAWKRLQPYLLRERSCYSLPRGIDLTISPTHFVAARVKRRNKAIAINR